MNPSLKAETNLPFLLQMTNQVTHSTKNNPFFSLIVLNWNSLEWISSCFDSIFSQTFKSFEVIVVDNGSTDSSLDLIEKDYPRVSLIQNKSNVGFAEGNNIGIRSAKGEWILLLNTDAIIPPTYLEEMIETIETHPELGSISCKLLRGKNGPIDSTGVVLDKKKFSPRDRGEDESDVGQYDEPEYIFGPTAAVGMYRKSALDEVSPDGEYLDKDFFAYYEDVDLAWRLQLMGWKSWYAPEIIAYHCRQGPFIKDRSVFRQAFANRYLLYVKNEVFSNFWTYIPWNFPYELTRCIRLFLREPYQLGMIKVFWKNFPKMVKKRNWIQSNSKVDVKEMRKFN